MQVFLREIKAMGFSGVQNFPTVGLIDGLFRQNLEETGMSFFKEVEMIGTAHELDLLTTPYVFTPEEAVEMVKAGADLLVAHMGLTTKGTIGAETAKTLDEAAAEIQAIHDAAKEVKEEIMVICHGGPVSEPEDVRYVLEHTRGIVGFFGASSVERLPTERAITGQVKSFKQIALQA
jgi:predicted TIM-barrel enzyme